MSLESLMSMFRTGTPAQTPPPGMQPMGPSQVALPGQPLPGTQHSPQTAANGTVPAGAGAAPTGNESPLDAFKSIWETPANTAKTDTGPMFGAVDPKKLMESAGQVDFAKAITAETLQAITAGGEGAVTALATAMNKVAQTVYAQSAFATTKIVDQATAKMQERFDAQLPSLITRHSVNSGLADNNPALSNPALAPVVSALSEQLIRKNPNATSAEIQLQVNDYLKALGSTFAPAPPAGRKGNQAVPKTEDWGKFFEN